MAGSDQREGPETEGTLKLSGPSASLLTLPPRRFFARLAEMEKRRNANDVRQFLGNLRLPKEVEWVTDLEFEEWIIDSGDESLELTASTKQGYLTMFVVDDGR